MNLPNRDQLASSSGREINCHGRMYLNGSASSMDFKLAVADTYQSMARQSGRRPVLEHIAQHHRVDRKFVRKIEAELFAHGMLLSPKEIRVNQDRPIGPGSMTLSNTELYIIIRLYYEDPNRHLRNYRDWLIIITGNAVCIDTISRVLLHGFPYKGNLVKPNLVPIDKFKPENEVRAYEYLKALFFLHPDKVLFGDEKHFKGEEVYNRKVRKSPLDGNTPAIITDSDFRNVYNITAFCSISERKKAPVWSRICKLSNTAVEFATTCEMAGEEGFFEPHDVLVIDNATVHNLIIDMMWDRYRVHVLFLPTRSPEWNPKELIWNSLVKKLNCEPITALSEIKRKYQCTSDTIMYAARDKLDQFTFKEVRKYYSKCYDFFAHWRSLST